MDGCGKRGEVGTGEGEERRERIRQAKRGVGGFPTDVRGEAWSHHTHPFTRAAGMLKNGTQRPLRGQQADS